MDMMLLVVDATKGIQAQTTECVVIGEAVMSSGADAIVVLNKVDLIPEQERKARLRQAEKEIAAQLAGTKLSSASFVSCAAAVGGEKTAASTPLAGSRSSKGRAKKAGVLSGNVGSAAGATSHEKGSKDVRPGGGDDAAEPLSGATPPRPPSSCSKEISAMGIDAVAGELSRRARVPSRRASAPLYFAFDHCFSVRGQGTILTGTVLTGEVKVNQLVELPSLRLQKKVKSMQMFRKPVSIARAGDRVGMCVASLDAKLMERGVVTTPGSVRPISAAIALVRKVPAFTGQCLSGAYCHVSLGHSTAMATATFFGASELKNGLLGLFEHSADGLKVLEALRDAGQGQDLSLNDIASLPFPSEAAFVQQTQLCGVGSENSIAGADDEVCVDERPLLQYCHLTFHTPVITPPSSVVLGSRLDSTSSSPNKTEAAHPTGETIKGLAAVQEHCRIAFHGRLVSMSADVVGTRKGPGDARAALEFGTQAGQLKLFTEKCKSGVVFRVTPNDQTGGGAVEVFGKDLFKKETNMPPFVGMLLLTEGGSVGHLESTFGKAGRFKARFPAGTLVKVGDKLILKFRKYFRDPSKRMHQGYLREALERHPHQPIEGARTADNPTDDDNDHDNRDEGAPGSAAATTTGVEEPAAQETREESPPPPHLRDGVVDSVKEGVADDEPVAIAFVSGLFSQEEDIREIAKRGMSVRTETGGLVGRLKGPFGKLGKCKVVFEREEGGYLRPGERVFVPR
ncbi:unnamed protein product [Ectocarpus sp. 8 AP-2014]